MHGKGDGYSNRIRGGKKATPPNLKVDLGVGTPPSTKRGRFQDGNGNCLKLPCIVAPEQPTLSRPVGRVGAFNLYRPSSNLTTALQPDFGISKFLDGVDCDPIIPSRCGHGCCGTPTVSESRSSLLGPKFVDYEEPPSFSSHELASIATDLNSIAWIKSGLDKRLETPVQRRDCQATSSGAGNSGSCLQNSNLRFEEGRTKLMGMMTEVLSNQIPRQSVALPAEVEGFS